MPPTTLGVPTQSLSELRRPDSARRQLDQVIGEASRVRERLESAREREQAAVDRYQDLASQPADAAQPVDLSALEARSRAVRSQIALEDQLARARQQSQKLERDAQRALGLLSPAPDSLEELLNLPALGQDTMNGLLTRKTQLRDDQMQLDADRRQLNDREAEHAALIEQLRHHGQVTTASDVGQSRDERDEQWNQLRDNIQAGQAPGAEAVGCYEAAVARADGNADELVRDAAGAELAKRVAADSAQLATIDGQLRDRQAGIDAAHEAIAREWAAEWAPTGLAPVALDRVRDWERARQSVVAAAVAAGDAEGTVSSLASQIAAAEATLRKRLVAHRTVADSATLTELIELADAHIEANEACAAAAARRQLELDQSQRELSAAEKELAMADANLHQWLSAWPQQRHAAGLPETVAPEQAHEASRTVTEALAAQRQTEQVQARIAGIDRDRVQLNRRLQDLVDDAASDLVGRDAWQAAAILKDRLAEQQRRQSTHAELARRRDDADAAADRAQQACEKAQQELDELCLAAGCESLDELLDVEERCGAAAELDRDIAELDARIVERGRDELENLAAAVADLDVEEAEKALTRLGEERQSLEHERDGVNQEIGQARVRIAATEEDLTAVTAAEDVEFSQARIVELARQYAIARLSASVIRRAIERYRDRNENPLVARANELFGRFTEGTYAELLVDVDDKGRGCLVARTNNRSIHTMEQMSKGTREQLFLALRIAAIERYVERSGPVPVLFDDVFVESDDARCAQIFAALGELSAKTQVIVLTHHHHMVAIARKALGHNLHVQELPAAQTRLRAAA